MGLQSDTLVLFNMEALRSKREVVASIEDYILPQAAGQWGRIQRRKTRCDP